MVGRSKVTVRLHTFLLLTKAFADKAGSHIALVVVDMPRPRYDEEKEKEEVAEALKRGDRQVE